MFLVAFFKNTNWLLLLLKHITYTFLCCYIIMNVLNLTKKRLLYIGTYQVYFVIWSNRQVIRAHFNPLLSLTVSLGSFRTKLCFRAGGKVGSVYVVGQSPWVVFLNRDSSASFSISGSSNWTAISIGSGTGFLRPSRAFIKTHCVFILGANRSTILSVRLSSVAPSISWSAIFSK